MTDQTSRDTGFVKGKLTRPSWSILTVPIRTVFHKYNRPNPTKTESFAERTRGEAFYLDDDVQ